MLDRYHQGWQRQVAVNSPTELVSLSMESITTCIALEGKKVSFSQIGNFVHVYISLCVRNAGGITSKPEDFDLGFDRVDKGLHHWM
jgi:hypothetical protein